MQFSPPYSYFQDFLGWLKAYFFDFRSIFFLDFFDFFLIFIENNEKLEKIQPNIAKNDQKWPKMAKNGQKTLFPTPKMTKNDRNSVLDHFKTSLQTRRSLVQTRWVGSEPSRLKNQGLIVLIYICSYSRYLLYILFGELFCADGFYCNLKIIR